jgi:hypothetical protein
VISAAPRVFGSVHVATGADEEARLSGIITPLVLVRPMNGTADKDAPHLISQAWQLRLVVSVEGDDLGETALVGGAIDSASSAGRGLLEIEEQMIDRLAAGSSEVGFLLVEAWRGGAQPAKDPNLGYVAYCDYEMASKATAVRTYHPATRLAGTLLGGGSVSLTWRLPPDRFDRYRVVLRRAAGSTPPAGPTDGTGVTLSGLLATSVTDTPGAGTFSYSLFAQYDDYNPTPSVVRATAAADTLTVVVT